MCKYITDNEALTRLTASFKWTHRSKSPCVTLVSAIQPSIPLRASASCLGSSSPSLFWTAGSHTCSAWLLGHMTGYRHWQLDQLNQIQRGERRSRRPRVCMTPMSSICTAHVLSLIREERLKHTHTHILQTLEKSDLWISLKSWWGRVMFGIY